MMILKVSLVLGCLTTLALSTKSGRIGSPNTMARIRASEEKGPDPDEELKLTTQQGAEYSISRKRLSLCNLVKNITEGDPTAKEIEIRTVPGPILGKIVEYLKHHDGKAPAGTNFPTGPNFPIRSCEMEKLVEDPWDAEFINRQTPNVIFQMILGANYMEIPSLLHLGCTKIATLIKGESLLAIQMFFAAQNRLPTGLIATIASYVVYKVDKRRDAYDLCNAMGLTEEEISPFLGAGMFAQAERWDRFDDTDKGRNVTLSNNNRTASRSGVVRAGKLVPRDGHASATVRVDRCHGRFQGFEIGVIGVAEGYDWSTGNLIATYGEPAWCYDNWGDIYGKGYILSDDNDGVPGITEGSEVTVTLTGGIVTFTHNGTDVYAIELPEDCGPISLAVNIYGNGSKVTLL